MKEAIQQLQIAFDMIENLQGRSTSSKSMIVTGDMHVGHKFALNTGEFYKTPDKLQSIRDLWYNARDRLHKERCNIFFLNGEHIDGDNKKEGGHQVWSTDLNDQFADAEKLLRHYKMDGLGMNRGSNYHTTKDNTGLEEMFINSIKDIAPKIYQYSPFGNMEDEENKSISFETREWDDNGHAHIRIDDLFVCRLHDKVFHLMHHIGGSKWFSYIPTALGREMAQMKFFDGKLWKVDDSPKFIIRSHTHRYVQIRYPNSAGIVTPAWKIFDRFGLKSGQDAGTIGLIEIVVESNGEFLINDITLTNEDYPKLNIIDIE